MCVCVCVCVCSSFSTSAIVLVYYYSGKVLGTGLDLFGFTAFLSPLFLITLHRSWYCMNTIGRITMQ